MNDRQILEHITDLVDKEHRLRSDAVTADQNAEHLRHVTEQLDPCWDLLRQRRARREFGDAADSASMRPVGTVESYEG